MLKCLSIFSFGLATLLESALLANKLEVVELEPFFVKPQPSQAPSMLGDEWRNRGTVGLAEALESAQPGVSLIRKAGMSNDVVVRGLSGDDVSVTLDGRKIFVACSNRMDPPLSHATAENAEQVEIAAGPFSLKRSGSLGGHINIVSAPIESGWHGYGRAGLASFNQQHHSVSSSYGESAWAVRFFGGYLSGDPYETGAGLRITDLPTLTAAYLPEFLDGPAYEAWHAGAEFEWTFDGGQRLRLNGVRREDSDLLFPGLKMDADATQSTQLGLRLTQEDGAGHLENWVADIYFNETKHLMTDSKRSSSREMGGVPRPAFVLNRGYFMLTDAIARNWGATFDAEADADDWGYWSFGGEFGQREWESANTLLNIENAMLPDVLASTVGVYGESRFEIQSDWILEAGLRLDWFSVDPRGDTSLLETRLGGADRYTAVEPGGSVSVRYTLNDQTTLFAGMGTIARAPNPQELYIQVDKPMMNEDWLGNPELDAPRSSELTAGFEWTKDKWQLRVRGFHSWLSDYIYSVGLGTAPADTQSYANIDARLYGIESSLGYQLNDAWSLALGLAWQEGRKESGVGTVGNRTLAEIPPLRVQAGLQYQTEKTLLKLEVQASEEQDRIDPDLNEQNVDAWMTVSLYAQRFFGERWTLSCAVVNLFDEDYAVNNAQVRNPFSAFTVIGEPGRTFKASLSYAF